jgi:hypothetical protein
MYAYAIANHRLPKMRGYPFSVDLVYRTIKSIGYSQESIYTIKYFNTPLEFIVDLSTSWSIVGVCLNNPWRFNLSIVYLVMTFMAAPKSMKVFWIRLWMICTFITGLPRSKYLGTNTMPSTRSTRWPTTFTVGESFFFLLCLFRHYS